MVVRLYVSIGVWWSFYTYAYQSTGWFVHFSYTLVLQQCTVYIAQCCSGAVCLSVCLSVHCRVEWETLVLAAHLVHRERG